MEINYGSRINSADVGNLILYHSGNKISFDSEVPSDEKYNFSGTIYSQAEEIYIDNGARVNGSIYAEKADLYIRGGIIANQLLYVKSGDIVLENGARVSGEILSGGNNINIIGGSLFDGREKGLYAPEAYIRVNMGANIIGNIFANPSKVSIDYIDPQISEYSLIDTRDNNEIFVEEVCIYSDTESPIFILSRNENNQWLRIFAGESSNRSFCFRDNFQANRLLVYNPLIFNITELKINAYSTINRNADVQILTPVNKQSISDYEFSNHRIIGYVDNPNTEVFINNQNVYKRGHYFWIDTNLIETNNFYNKIVAAVIDQEGRISRKEIEIYIEEESLIVLDQDDDIIYTDAANYILSGSIYPPLNSLYINNKQVDISNQRFSTELSLKEGFNLIELEGQVLDNDGLVQARRKLYTQIIKHSTGIELEIQDPEDASHTNQVIIDISGIVSGRDQLSVYVNGIQANIDGMNFTTRQFLREGSNIITIEASDQINSIEKEIEVIKDTLEPMLLFLYDSLLSSSNMVFFEGTVLDRNPVSFTINGQPVDLINSRFAEELFFNDGNHLVTMRAVDLAGNETIRELNLTVDTIPPVDFEVEVEPEGWTNQNEVMISFESSDNISGISHYELSINGEDFYEVSSPYQLSFEEDGVHEIIIKAVNHVGLITEAEANVYIDTTPPPVAHDFRAVAGSDYTAVRWDRYPEQENIKEYHLYRDPVWHQEDYLVIDVNDTILGDNEEILEYRDKDVNLGHEYSYWLQVVDKAGNINEITEESTIEAGITIEEVKVVDEDDMTLANVEEKEPIRVEYQSVELSIPVEAIPEDGSIQITGVQSEETSQIQSLSQSNSDNENIIITDSVHFQFQDVDGEQKIDVQFEEELTVTFDFDIDLIPEGYTPFDLDVYYYTEAEGNWIRLEGAGIDLETGKISAKTDHFSIYNVQVNQNYAPGAEAYEDLGLSPYKSYFKQNQEYVSPSSGSLTLTGIDLSLPGRNGLNLELGRIYNSSTVTMELLKKAFNSNAVVKGYDSFGVAWNINLPWIEVNSDGTFVYFEDGSASKISWNRSEDGSEATATATYREGKYFRAEKVQKLEGYWFDIFGKYIGGNWEDQSYTIIKKDGTVYNFNGNGMITEIIDRTGENRIKFEYKGREIDYIIDSLGRKIEFKYREGKIEKIKQEDRVYRYEYDNDRLTKVIDPEGRETEYVYTSNTVTRGSRVRRTEANNVPPEVRVNYNNVKHVTVPLVKEIIYPTRGKTIYEYSRNGVIWEGTGGRRGTAERKLENGETKKIEWRLRYEWTVYDRSTIVVDNHYQKSIEEENLLIKPTRYEYTFNHEYEDNRKTLSSKRRVADQDSFRIEKTRRLDISNDEINIEQLNSEEINKEDIKKETIMDFNDDGLMTEKTINDQAGNEIERIVYQYESKFKEIRGKRVYKDGETRNVYQEIYDYDNWGNLTNYQHTGTGLEVKNYYYNTDSSDNVDNEFANIDFNLDGIFIDENKNIRNRLAGRKVYNSNARDREIVEESAYLYDSKGNLLKEAVYLENEDGESNWQISSYDYDDYGNVRETIDPRGVKTVLEYSEEYNHGFLTQKKITGIDGQITDAAGEVLPPVIHSYGYELNTGLKTWEIDPEGNLTEYEYDNLARLIKIMYPTDEEQESIASIPRENLSRNNYDELRTNNPVKIQYYNDQERSTTVVNATSNIEVDDNKVLNNIIEDSIFNKSRYHYDSLNRWVKLEQFLREDELADGQNSPFITEFTYDQHGNREATIDAMGNKTVNEYDALNRIRTITYPDGTSTEIDYDNHANSRIITDPEGLKTIEIKDWDGNITEVTKIKNRIKLSRISASYDRTGKLISETDANRHRTDYYYDHLGRLVRVELPEDEYILPGDDYSTEDYRPIIRYEYDDSGNMIKEIRPEGNIGINPEGYTYQYQYDQLNRRIKTIDPAGNILKTFYDQAGRVIQEVDPLGNVFEVIYDSHGNQIAAIDGEGNISYSEYNIIGQQTASYDPRGVVPAIEKSFEDTITINGVEYGLDPKYLTAFSYDSLGRQIKTTDPLGNSVSTSYDEVGNVRKVVNGEQTIKYEYNDLYFLRKETVNPDDEREMITVYEHDKVGNVVKERSPRNETVIYKYDDLYRLREVIRPDESTVEYRYDAVGNRTFKKDGNGNETIYIYNSNNELYLVREPGDIETKDIETKYYYDLSNNLVRKEMANGLRTNYSFNNLGQLIKEDKPLNTAVEFKYDEAGNLEEMINSIGIKEVYRYNSNNRLRSVEYYAPDSAGNYSEEPAEIVNYDYDKAGNRILAERRIEGNILAHSIEQKYDPLNRIREEKRNIEGRSYSTEYRYDRYGNLSGIKYPGSSEWLEYKYDDYNLIKGIENIAPGIGPDFTYHEDGSLETITYANGIKTKHALDSNSRIKEIKITKNKNTELLKLNYEYDGASNVKERIENDTYTNTYKYDQLNRLKEAKIHGAFYQERGSNYGYVEEDYFGQESLNTAKLDTKVITLDYASGSVGIDLGRLIENISRIELKTTGISNHRLTEETLDIYYSNDNSDYQLLNRDEWEYRRDIAGNITIELDNVEARYIKVHSKFSDRDPDFELVNKGEFTNILKELITVYERREKATITYNYDKVGNRRSKYFDTGRQEMTDYLYYNGSNRLKSDGNYGYVYDNAGNLIEKGNYYTIEGEEVIFTAKEGSGVEYWQYEYNLQNRLSRVKKNRELIAEFSYDVNGMRIMSREQEVELADFRTTYFVYGYSGRVLMEESSATASDTKYTSYIYAFAKTFAKVDGILDSATVIAEDVTFYHHDNLGSTRLMTDHEGNVTFDQDYMPFGGDLPGVNQHEVQNDENEGYKYTGQREVVSIGLYYYGARYYDPGIARFITEDSWPGRLSDPQTQNTYIYTLNNPMKYIDPTGNVPEEVENILEIYELDIDLSYLEDLNLENMSLDELIGEYLYLKYILPEDPVAQALDYVPDVAKDAAEIGVEGYELYSDLSDLSSDLINYRYTLMMNSLISNRKRVHNEEQYMNKLRNIIQDVPKMMTAEYGIEYAGQYTFRKYIQFDVTRADLDRLEDNISKYNLDDDIFYAYRAADNIFRLAGLHMSIETIMDNVPYYNKVTFITAPIYGYCRRSIEKGGYDPYGFVK
ncbi:RHS repeat-associated core domain-containing protein [Natronospora cellulosivora (SeqCode)]